MASIDDVLAGLVTVCQTAIQQAGITNPYVGPYPGWPVPTALDADIRALKTHISIFVNDNEKLYTRWRSPYVISVDADVGLSATVSGTSLLGGQDSPITAASGTVTFLGEVTGGARMIGFIGNIPVAFTPASGIVLSSVASGFVTEINSSAASGIVTASASGNVVTIVANGSGASGNVIGLSLQIGGTGFVKQEQRRQRRQFTIDIWAPNNALRALFADAIDNYIATQDFIGPLTDQQDEYARIYYTRTIQTDKEMRHGIFRRILTYEIEYQTTSLLPFYQVLDPQVNVSQGPV